MPGRRQIEARWGVKFWKLVSDFADQGLCRSDVAKALGYDRRHFYRMLEKNPDQDPFEQYNKAVVYLADTGETIGQALERMALEGRSWAYAAVVIGYSEGWVLKRAARDRGILTELHGRPGRPRSGERKDPVDSDFTTGWPSWKQVYAMGSSAK